MSPLLLTLAFFSLLVDFRFLFFFLTHASLSASVSRPPVPNQSNSWKSSECPPVFASLIRVLSMSARLVQSGRERERQEEGARAQQASELRPRFQSPPRPLPPPPLRARSHARSLSSKLVVFVGSASLADAAGFSNSAEVFVLWHWWVPWVSVRTRVSLYQAVCVRAPCR